MMLSSVMPCLIRLSFGASFTNIAPAFDDFEKLAPFKPATHIKSSIPFTSLSRVWILSRTLSVCASETPSGSCAVMKM